MGVVVFGHIHTGASERRQRAAEDCHPAAASGRGAGQHTTVADEAGAPTAPEQVSVSIRIVCASTFV